MIGPGTGFRVYLACDVTDMRKGIAGLSALTQDLLRQKPTGGAVFAFRGRSGDGIKILYWVEPFGSFQFGPCSPFRSPPIGDGPDQIFLTAEHFKIQLLACLVGFNSRQLTLDLGGVSAGC